MVSELWFRAILFSPLPPHLKADISSPSGNLDWVKWGLSPSHTWQQLNNTHISSSVTPGTVSMAATGKSFQTGQGGKEWESPLSPPWTRHSEKPGTRMKMTAQPGRDWGPWQHHAAWKPLFMSGESCCGSSPWDGVDGAPSFAGKWEQICDGQRAFVSPVLQEPTDCRADGFLAFLWLRGSRDK